MLLESLLQLPNCSVNQVMLENNSATIVLSSTSEQAACPTCQKMSNRVHSYYNRHPADLPICGLSIQLVLTSKRYRCQNQECDRQTFCERLKSWLPYYSRRTRRLKEAQYQTGLSLGGQAARRLLAEINMETSRDTVLRILRQGDLPDYESPRVLGIDDWAIRSGCSYGTILIDLEKHTIVDLLPERTADCVAEWLKAHPSVEIVTRDRSNVYANGISEGAPQAEQIADRFHLLQNLIEATQKVLKKHTTDIEKALFPSEKEGEMAGSFPIIEPTPADKRRQQRVRKVHELADLGWYVTDIAKHVGVSRPTVMKYLELSPEAVILNRKPKKSLIGPYVSYLHQRWQEGCRKQNQLYQEICDLGYRGTESNVRKYIRSRIRTEQSENRNEQRPPSARTLAFYITYPYENQSKRVKKIIDQIKEAHPDVTTCIDLARKFAAMVRQRLPHKLDGWLKSAEECGVSAFVKFAKSLKRDKAAVYAALDNEWSNGPTEGFVNKLKMIKRQMYGRANLDLLKIRLLAHPT